MNRYNKKYRIIEVLDNDTQDTSIDWGYRIGRECYIIVLEKDKCLIFEYPNGGIVRTSLVQEIQKENDLISVKTYNRTYVFKLITEGK